MAVLGSNFLNGCNSIPDFIAAGSRMVFEQTAAPTSWTKEVNAAFNNVALRVIGGVNGTALVPGGASPFTGTFTPAEGITVPFSGPSNLTVQPASGFLDVGAAGSAVDVQQRTLQLAQMTAHNHDYVRRAAGTTNINGSQSQNLTIAQQFDTLSSGPVGGGGHDHLVTDNQHTHPISLGTHTHVDTDSGHTHTFTMTQRNFGVLYMDVIICSKN